MPEVRQLIAADGHGVVEEVGWVDGDGDLVDFAAAGVTVDRVAVNASLSEGHAAPGLVLTGTQHNRIVGDHDGRVDGQGQLEDAVTAVDRNEAVRVNAALRELQAAPEVGQGVVAHLFGLSHQVLLRLVQREGDHAVAKSLAVEGDGINALLREGLVAVAHREVVGADPLLLGARRGRDDREVDGDEAVAAVRGVEVDVVVAGLVEGGRAVSVGQGLFADDHGVVVVVGGVDVEGEVGDGETVVVIGFGDVVGAGLAEGLVHEGVGQLAVADGHGGRELGVRGDGERQMPDAVAAVGGLQADSVAARLVEAVLGIEEVGQCTLADGHRRVAAEGRVHVEVQMDDAVAVIDGLIGNGVVARFPILLVVPHIRHIHVADADGDVSAVGREDGQGDRGGAVAAVDVLAFVHESEGAGIGHQRVETILAEGLALADGRAVLHVGSCVDGEMQGVGAGAAVAVHVRVGVNTCFIVSLAIPSVCAASGCFGDIMRAVMDGEVQRDHGVAAGSVGEGVDEVVA